MKLYELKDIERNFIYHDLMINDFPKDELKPFIMIEKLVSSKKMFCYGINDAGKLIGYAYFAVFENLVILDYFAILREHRGNGAGSKALELIIEKFSNEFDCLIIEVEDPDFAINEQDKMLRLKRVDFYIKNGFEKTSLKAKLFNVEYIEMKVGKLSDTQIKEKIYGLYIASAGEELCSNNVFLD